MSDVENGDTGVPSGTRADAVDPNQVTVSARDTPTESQRISVLEAEIAGLRELLSSREPMVGSVVLDDERVLQDVGIYRYHHPLENAAAYKNRLHELGERIALMVKAGTAIESSNSFTFDGSLAKGRKLIADLGRLMLRAYNAEADNAIRTLRVGNVETATKRLEASREAIARLSGLMRMRIAGAFHSLRVEEIELTADYLMKKREEREAAAEARELLREQRKVELELAAERERLEKERAHLATAVERLRELGSMDEDLERRLAEIQVAIERNDYRAANIRAGYVYVISNRGAFGENVVKIGLTRRLDPQERIDELGGASVPFRFDVHVFYFSEDAVSLEQELHQHFAARRLNWANNRKEFFFASPAEVRDVLAQKLGSLLDFSERAEATEYFQSSHYWPPRAV